MKKYLSILFLGSMILTLSGCGMTEKQETAVLVKGNIDTVNKGIITETYLEILDDGTTLVDAENDYEESMIIEADYLAYYWWFYDEEAGETFEDLDESLQEDMIRFCKEMYRKTKYEVGEPVPLLDGSYTVKLSIEPLDIMQKADEMYMNDDYEPLRQLSLKYENVDFNHISENDYQVYSDEYARTIMQMLWELLPESGYLEAENLVIRVETDEDGYMSINDDDWSRLNETLVYYP